MLNSLAKLVKEKLGLTYLQVIPESSYSPLIFRDIMVNFRFTLSDY